MKFLSMIRMMTKIFYRMMMMTKKTNLRMRRAKEIFIYAFFYFPLFAFISYFYLMRKMILYYLFPCVYFSILNRIFLTIIYSISRFVLLTTIPKNYLSLNVIMLLFRPFNLEISIFLLFYFICSFL
jgi:hypothetical protein